MKYKTARDFASCCKAIAKLEKEEEEEEEGEDRSNARSSPSRNAPRWRR